MDVGLKIGWVPGVGERRVQGRKTKDGKPVVCGEKGRKVEGRVREFMALKKTYVNLSVLDSVIVEDMGGWVNS